MMNDRVMANKRISCHCLLGDSSIKGNLRGLLERGVQESMDKEEVFDKTLEVAIGYAGSMGTSLWSEIKEDRAKVGPGYCQGGLPSHRLVNGQMYATCHTDYAGTDQGPREPRGCREY
jgi:hypothetical protein